MRVRYKKRENRDKEEGDSMPFDLREIVQTKDENSTRQWKIGQIHAHLSERSRSICASM